MGLDQQRVLAGETLSEKARGCLKKQDSLCRGSPRGTFKKEEAMPGSHVIEKSRDKSILQGGVAW